MAFFAIKDNLNIMPAARAIFSIFFLYSLFNKIQICPSKWLYPVIFISMDVRWLSTHNICLLSA
ncbi:hypothetical protein F966_02251 [Acinetobacter higginsii]|uniref:Uncharacterized protein n=1 Tax=Acinetobacter higginsii TaxID=70347 RepID=N8WCH7_9GAMM|nr:hypothetical protein F966_02251 [Acinetobacter higginsii]